MFRYHCCGGGYYFFCSGIDLDGSTVGLAYIRVMCSSGCAGLSQDGGRSLSGVSITVAHELGHNFNMNHDGGKLSIDFLCV